jgi:hypothetical protein
MNVYIAVIGCTCILLGIYAVIRSQAKGKNPEGSLWWDFLCYIGAYTVLLTGNGIVGVSLAVLLQQRFLVGLMPWPGSLVIVAFYASFAFISYVLTRRLLNYLLERAERKDWLDKNHKAVRARQAARVVSDQLALSLKAYGLQPGDEVLQDEDLLSEETEVHYLDAAGNLNTASLTDFMQLLSLMKRSNQSIPEVTVYQYPRSFQGELPIGGAPWKATFHIISDNFRLILCDQRGERIPIQPTAAMSPVLGRDGWRSSLISALQIMGTYATVREMRQHDRIVAAAQAIGETKGSIGKSSALAAIRSGLLAD